MDTHHHYCCYREQISYALYSKFREPKLYRYAYHMNDWDRIPIRCTSHPKEAMFVHKYPPNDTPLHRIVRPTTTTTTTTLSVVSGTTTTSSSSSVMTCSNNNSSTTTTCTKANDNNNNNNTAVMETQQQQQVVEEEVLLLLQMKEIQIAAVIALINVHPAALLVRDTFGRTPLHWACMNIITQYNNNNDNDNNTSNNSDSNDNVAMIILRSCPECVITMVDNEQRTPLHVLVARNIYIPINVVLYMITINPSIISMTDIVHETPIQILQRRYNEIDNASTVIKILLQHQQQQQPVSSSSAANGVSIKK